MSVDIRGTTGITAPGFSGSHSGDGSGLADVPSSLNVHHWYDPIHRAFGAGGIYVLSNTFNSSSTNSTFIITCSIVVGAEDNVGGHIQVYKNGAWSTLSSARGLSAQQDYNNSSWGDLALRHEGGMPGKWTTTTLWAPGVSGTVGVRMYIQAENGTRYINRRNNWGSSPNDITGVSSITVQEIL